MTNHKQKLLIKKPQFNSSHSCTSNSQRGIALLEALIAVLIFSMGLLALAGLQAAMIKNTSDAKYRADASFIVQQRLGAIWADPANLAAYGEVDADVSALLPNGVRNTVVAPATGEVSIVVTWQLPGQDTHNFTANARVTGG